MLYFFILPRAAAAKFKSGMKSYRVFNVKNPTGMPPNLPKLEMLVLKLSISTSRGILVYPCYFHLLQLSGKNEISFGKVVSGVIASLTSKSIGYVPWDFLLIQIASCF